MVNVIYMVGFCYEVYGEIGMVYLLEYLVFKGIFDYLDILKEFNEYGVCFNGIIWYDCINYFEIMSVLDENLCWVFEMEVDCMVNFYIFGDDLESEMMVVCNEFEMGENSFIFVLLEWVLLIVYLWYNYGKFIIGVCVDIENVLIECL